MPPDQPSRSAVAVAHVLPADVRNQLRALADVGLLRRVFAGFSYAPGRGLERWGKRCDAILGTNLTTALARRPELGGVDTADIERTLLPEAVQLLCRCQRFSRNHSLTVNDWTKRHLSTAAARCLRASDRLSVAREFEARELFQKAADLNVPRLYQLPTPHYQTVDVIVRRELALYPDAELLAAQDRSVASRRVERKEAELALASHILVPSLFVKDSLLAAGVDEARIHVLPFGTEGDWIADAVSPKNENLFLHVGQLSVRKGTHRLLRAWKKLGAFRTCELRLIGAMRLPSRLLSEFPGIFNYVGRLPRKSLQQHYATASCFVFPALAEGFAVVILESISCGTPVVASRNSGAEGFIADGEEGLLHDSQDDEQLCEKLEWMLSNPRRREEMSRRCLQKAQSWTWERYRAKFLEFIHQIISSDFGINGHAAS